MTINTTFKDVLDYGELSQNDYEEIWNHLMYDSEQLNDRIIYYLQGLEWDDWDKDIFRETYKYLKTIYND